jgi:hygromycin-B 7''-O-kinase
LIPDIGSAAEFDREFANPEWTGSALEICRLTGLDCGRAERAGGSEHVVVLVDDGLAIKVYRPGRDCFRREIDCLSAFAGQSPFPIPEVVATGNFRGLDYLVMTRVAGEPMTRAEWLQLPVRDQSRVVAELGAGLRSLHEAVPRPAAGDWAEFVAERAATLVERQIRAGVNSAVIDALPRFIETNLPLVPVAGPLTAMHADVHFGNLRLTRNGGRWRISGLIDFADSRTGFHEYEFLAVGVLMIQGQGGLQREFFRAYGYRDDELDEEMRRRLMMLTALYETADLRRYAMRLAPEAVDWPLERLERSIWSFA